jgi:hypothetical protein
VNRIFLDSIKGGDVLDHLSNYQLLKETLLHGVIYVCIYVVQKRFHS